MSNDYPNIARMVGIVRDGKTGKPKFSDLAGALPEIKAMLTDADIACFDDDELNQLGLMHRRKKESS